MPPIVTGFPDVMALRNGQTIFIEVKNGEKGKLGFQQAKFISKLRQQGFVAVVIKNLEEWQQLQKGL